MPPITNTGMRIPSARARKNPRRFPKFNRDLLESYLGDDWITHVDCPTNKTDSTG